VKRFKNILYHADGAASPGRSLDRALALAQSNNAALTVMDVVPKSDLGKRDEQRFGLNLDPLFRQHRLEELEVRSRDPDDLVRDAVERERRADGFGIPAHLVSPVVVVEHGDARTSHRRFLRGWEPTFEGLRAQNAEEVGADPPRDDRDRAIAQRATELSQRERAPAVEGPRALAIVRPHRSKASWLASLVSCQSLRFTQNATPSQSVFALNVSK